MDDAGKALVRATRTARRVGWATLAIALGLGLWAAGKLYAYSLEPYRDGVQRAPLNEAFPWLLAGGTSLAIAIVAFIVAEARRVGRWQPELVVTALVVPALLAWGLFSLDRQRQIDVTVSRGFRSGFMPAPLPGRPQPWLVNSARAAEVALRAIGDLQAARSSSRPGPTVRSTSTPG